MLPSSDNGPMLTYKPLTEFKVSRWHSACVVKGMIKGNGMVECKGCGSAEVGAVSGKCYDCGTFNGKGGK